MKKLPAIEVANVQVSDTDARLWLEELKARPSRTPAMQDLIDELEAAWRKAAEPDMRRSKG